MNKTLADSGDCLTAENVKIPVLLYHVVSTNPDRKNQYQFGLPEFKKQMEYLNSNGYSTLSAEEFHQILHKAAPMRKKPVLLTFDDCTSDFYTNVYPVLKQYGMKAIQFAVSNWIDTPGHITSSQLKIVSQNGIDVENHTQDHCFLTGLSHDQKLLNLQAAAAKITSIVGKAAEFFAYPYGDYDAVSIGPVKIKKGDKWLYAFLSEGFMQVTADKTVVFADSAEWPEEIDVKRAKAAEERARKRLTTQLDHMEYARSQAALQRALLRQKVSEKKNS